MLFHSDKLTMVDLAVAADNAGARLSRYKQLGSKIRKHKFDVIFGTEISNTRDKATWNQTGVILEQLFNIDPELFVGSGSISQGDLFYNGREDFHDKTDGVFKDWRNETSPVYPFNTQNCIMHKWDNISKTSGIFHHSECRKCGIEFFPHGQKTPIPADFRYGLGYR